MKALGASSVSQPRKQTDTEEDRLRRAREKGALLRTVQLPWRRMLWPHRSFVLSAAAYGWTGRWPTQASCEKLFTSLTQSFGTGYLASRDLRKTLYGGTAHLSAVLLARAWQRLSRAKTAGFVPRWHNAPFTTLGMLQRRLKTIGFQERGVWRWQLPRAWLKHAKPSEHTLDLRQAAGQTEAVQLHNLRQQFRRFAFEAYLASSRHEAVELSARHSRQALYAAFGGIDLPKTREALDLGPGLRAAFLASSCSPMHLFRAQMEGKTGVCPFCGDPRGFHDHMLWRCSGNPLPAEVVVPLNPLTRRLEDGWAASAHVAASKDMCLHSTLVLLR